jgi:hypothetical protein
MIASATQNTKWSDMAEEVLGYPQGGIRGAKGPLVATAQVEQLPLKKRQSDKARTLLPGDGGGEY